MQRCDLHLVNVHNVYRKNVKTSITLRVSVKSTGHAAYDAGGLGLFFFMEGEE